MAGRCSLGSGLTQGKRWPSFRGFWVAGGAPGVHICYTLNAIRGLEGSKRYLLVYFCVNLSFVTLLGSTARSAGVVLGALGTSSGCCRPSVLTLRTLFGTCCFSFVRPHSIIMLGGGPAREKQQIHPPREISHSDPKNAPPPGKARNSSNPPLQASPPSQESKQKCKKVVRII